MVATAGRAAIPFIPRPVDYYEVSNILHLILLRIS